VSSKMAKKEGAKMVDIKFVDTLGLADFSCPIGELTDEVCQRRFRVRRLVHPRLEVD